MSLSLPLFTNQFYTSHFCSKSETFGVNCYNFHFHSFLWPQDYFPPVRQQLEYSVPISALRKDDTEECTKNAWEKKVKFSARLVLNVFIRFARAAEEATEPLHQVTQCDSGPLLAGELFVTGPWVKDRYWEQEFGNFYSKLMLPQYSNEQLVDSSHWAAYRPKILIHDNWK